MMPYPVITENDIPTGLALSGDEHDVEHRKPALWANAEGWPLRFR